MPFIAIITIIITKPKPTYSRQGLVRGIVGQFKLVIFGCSPSLVSRLRLDILIGVPTDPLEEVMNFGVSQGLLGEFRKLRWG